MSETMFHTLIEPAFNYCIGHSCFGVKCWAGNARVDIYEEVRALHIVAFDLP
jgi:hypothetical protein